MPSLAGIAGARVLTSQSAHDADAAANFHGGKKIVVTGGAGFIGAHLVSRLLNAGAHVTVVDSFRTGLRESLAAFHGHSGFTLLEHDVIVPYDLPADLIYNLACAASPPRYQADPVHTFRTSGWGAFNALELARRCGARVLQASTSEIYGNPLQHPQTEQYWGNVNPIGPRSCYDEGKRGAETLFSDFRAQYGTDARIVRIFNTYGPGMRADDGRVVSNFILQALRGHDITIYGDGQQTRSFCYIDDMIGGLMAAMTFEGTNPGPVNLGNPVEFTVRELADMVIAMTGSVSRISHVALPVDDPVQRRPDISLALALYGWKPAIDLRQGLPMTIDFFKRSIGRESVALMRAAS